MILQSNILYVGEDMISIWLATLQRSSFDKLGLLSDGYSIFPLLFFLKSILLDHEIRFRPGEEKINMVTFGLLAQLVEQLTFNQLVAGSNPAQPICDPFV